MKDLFRAYKLASKDKRLTFVMVFFALAGSGLSLAIPQIYKRFFDYIQSSLNTGTSAFGSQVQLLILAFIVISIFKYLSDSLEYYHIIKWWANSKLILTNEVLNKLFSLSLGYFERHPAGKIKERIDDGVNGLNNAMEIVLTSIIPQLIYFIVATYFIFIININLGLVFFVATPLFIFISRLYTKPLLKIQDRLRNAFEALSASFTESIINSRTIKSFATEGKHKGIILKSLRKANSYDLKYTRKRISMNMIRFSIVGLSQAAILGLGTYLTLNSKMTLGDFVLAWTYTTAALDPLWYLTGNVDNINRYMRSARRLFELVDTEPDVLDVPNAKDLSTRGGSIEFRNVSFRYKKKKVLSNFSLKISPGSTVAFVGKSGVGKSTLVKLLLRFYDPQNGAIIVDGQDIGKVTQKSLRENIGVVMQDSILFNDSAENNINYGQKRKAKQNVLIAAKAANAHDFIEALPNKYKTIVGERGVKLSGGEQQRINIARALLKNPPILVLDEATSSLDSESEQKIQDALWRLVKGRTTLIIAHRLSTIMRADVIVVMEKGKIVEMGKHDDLINIKDGVYANLHKIQSGGYLP